MSPLLDYRQYRELNNDGSVFCFTGGIESLTDGKTLWVRGKDCTIPVSLEKTQCWLLPMHEGDSIPDPPVQIRWNRVSTLSEGVKVFIGGQIKEQNNRLNFVSTKENPLVVIFYNCSDDELASELILAARTQGDYWNPLTPVSLLIGAMFLVYIASSLLDRPAFRLNVITALVAVFIPVLPIIPPGLLFTAVYRRFTWQARKLRAYRDLVEFGVSNESGNYGIKAYTMEIGAWIILLAGICLNIFFIFLILSLL